MFHRAFITIASITALSACSSYQASRIRADGSIPKGGKGVPFTLTKPEFSLTKVDGSDPTTYRPTVTYVPDPAHRYVVRLNPAFLANSTFDLAFGEQGELSSATSDVKQQVGPAITAIAELAADVASSAAAIGVLDSNAKALDRAANIAATQILSAVEQQRATKIRATRALHIETALAAFARTDSSECLNFGTEVRMTVCAVRAAPEAECAAHADGIERRMMRYLIPKSGRDKEKDKGEPLSTLVPLTDSESNCFAAAATQLEAAVARYESGLSPIFLLTAAPNGSPTPAVAAAGQALNKAATEPDLKAARRLMYATAVAVRPTAPDARYLQGILAPAALAGGDAAAINAGLEAVGISASGQGAASIEQIVRAHKVAAALQSARTLDPGAWRARYIVWLQAEIADRQRLALLANPSTNPELDRDVLALRKQLAAMVNLRAEFDRLMDLENRLDAIPRPSGSDRMSTTTEYTNLRKEADAIRTELAARISAATAAKDVKKPDDLPPPQVTWVGQDVIKESSDPAWLYTKGEDAGKFVITLKRGDSYIVPPLPTSLPRSTGEDR